MTASELRKKFLDFFAERGHTVIPSASLIPENDPSVLFTTAGMHPLVPYLLGEPHPGGKRLVNVQKCIRTQDIDDVGDNRHDTFFEMLGNWSLGDYFKKEAIAWSFEFLTDQKTGLGLDPNRLFVSVFAGDGTVPQDDESIVIWQEQYGKRGMTAKVGERIFTYGREKNWWGPAGQTGPCGPDTEMFYDLGMPHDPAFGDVCHPNCDCGRFVEIWNDVFMQFNKQEDGSFVPLPKPNVDTGMGLERVAMLLQGKTDVFATDLFAPIMEQVTALGSGTDVRARRIVADHVRTATFILSDGIVPSNLDRGYILRRLIRRAVRFGRLLGFAPHSLPQIAQTVIGLYQETYPNLAEQHDHILAEFAKEEDKFQSTIERGLKEFEKRVDAVHERMSGIDAFDLFSTYGFPLELTKEMAAERNVSIDEAIFWAEFAKHQDLSRSGSEKKFAGGLADHSAETTRLHTATHLLHRALKNVLGDHVVQKGSNITAERLRFDFTHPEKITAEQLKIVEDMVNKAIQDDLPMRYIEMTTDEAKTSGAIGYFDDKYAQLGGKIKVYMAGDDDQGYFSKEICGGPHVTQTGELGHFSIVKEEAVAAGIRRIKATVTGPTAPDAQKTSKNT